MEGRTTQLTARKTMLALLGVIALLGCASAQNSLTGSVKTIANTTKPCRHNCPQPITVAISPTTASVQVNNTQQFSATVSGTANTAVTWSVSQGAGTVSSSGLFTAPGSAETDVVTVTSQADTTKSASAGITVTAVPVQHIVSLNWQASTTLDVTDYNLYRGTVSGGPFAFLAPSGNLLSFSDSTVSSGATYYYVVTSIDPSGESGYSNQAQAVVPSP